MKPPKILNDLYRDMRDRRLLPLAVVLVLAMVAVPLLLRSDTEAPAVDPAAAEADVAPGAPMPAVLASDPGLRDYRERLNQLRSKDPFASEPVAAPDLSDSAIQDVSDAGAAIGGGGGLPDAATGTSATAAIGSGTATSDTATSSTTTTDSTSSGGSTGGGGTPPESGAQWFTYRVDLEVGRAGDTRRRQNVKRFEVLPSLSNPVVLYVGPAEGGSHAIFFVSEHVVRSRGKGRCRPSPSDCQALSLREGEEQKLDYAPTGGDADTFVIEVKRIRIVEIDEPAALDDRGARSENTDAYSGLSAFFGS